ncbi:MAG: hypothetical protein LBV33_05250, partial [Lachnospiraceae bacterium]|jgi:hypothetical protein|nr:hypothetical protein [Lachnospiraceae bacterium]
LIVPALAELAVATQPLRLIGAKKWRELAGAVGHATLVGLSTLAGVVIYLGINAKVSGNPLQFTIYQKEHWYQGVGFLPDTLRYIGENALNERFNSIGMAIWIPELVLFVLGVVLLVYGFRRQRLAMSLYLLVYIGCVYSATWLLSAGRYLACAVPVFMIAGEWLAKRERQKMAVYWLSGALFMVYMIAYLLGRQVM